MLLGLDRLGRERLRPDAARVDPSLGLVRLHRQMVAVTDSELATARELYAQAYEPVRAAPTLDALDRQHRLLGAADALEKRFTNGRSTRGRSLA